MLSDLGALGRVVRAALRNGTTRLPAELLPSATGEFLLHFEAPGFLGRVSVLGEKAGHVELGVVLFHLRPRTRMQAAELYLIGETIDAPVTDSVPPAADSQSSGDSAPESSLTPISSFDDHTLVDRSVDRPSPRLSSPELIPLSEPGKDEDPLLDRTIAGKYKLIALLGTGSAGAVYRALHEDLGRVVAVKVLHAHNQVEDQFVRRFKGEARAASRLDHRNVTRVLDFGQEKDGLLYLVMEYVAGQSLEALLQSERRVSQARVIDIGIQVCNALVVAHKEGIIHRDIKPENLLLVPSLDDDQITADLVKVCDFGMAKLKNPGDEDLTLGGMICGSPAYMSPEQIRGGTLDARADIYSLGITMYEALTGNHPFAAQTLLELFTKHESEQPRAPSELVPNMDSLFGEVLMRTLAKRPDDRQDSARTLRLELRAVAEQLQEDAPPSSVMGQAD